MKSSHEIQNQTVVAGFFCHVIVLHLTVTQIYSIHCHFLIHPCMYPLISEMKHFAGIILKELNLITNAFLSYFPFRTLCACALLGPDVFLISVDERAKHDQQFHSLSPNAGGYITGNGSCLLSQCVS